MPSWKLDETREIVERLHGASQLALLDPCLTSLVDRQIYAGYHYHEYKRLLRENIDSKLPEKHILELTLPRDPEYQHEFTTMLKRVGAHVVACVQSLHCLADTLAHAVCYSKGLNLPPTSLAERRISMKSVMSVISSAEGFGTVHRELKKIDESAEFTYISALVNHSKHRSIVEPVLNVGFLDEPGPPYQVKFARFNYDGKEYDKRDIEQVLEPTYSMLSNIIVDCGNSLNVALRTRHP